MIRAQGEVLFESGRLRVTHRSAGAPDRPLVVTFDSLNADLRLDRPGFGEAWLAGMGYDAVHVVGARNDWYQTPDLEEALSAVRAFARGRTRVVTYGSSMGGYAAARFAGRVGAQAAIALSPQFSVDPVKAPFEDRWTEYVEGVDFRWETPALEDSHVATVHVVYDPRNRDRLHMERLAAILPVAPAPVRHGGHPSTTFLAETGLLGPMATDMIEGRFDPAAFRAAVRGARARSGAYHHSLASRLPPRRAALAVRLWETAVRLSPASAVYLRALGERLEQAGDDAGAESALRTALSLEPDDPAGRLRLAEFLAARGGDREEVRGLVHDLRGLGAVRERLFLRVVDLLFLAGDFEAAAAEAQDALRRLPRSSALLARVLGLKAALALPGVGPALLRRARRAALARLGDRAKLQG